MGKDAGNNFTKREKLFPASFLLYAALTLVMAYPYSLHPAAGVLTIGTDTDLYIWALGWDVHAFLHHPFSIFDANIFFPFKHTLAYSENVLGSAIFAAPIIWVTGNPMLAFNLIALLSIPLSAYGAYLLGRRLGLSQSAAILCGLIFGFAPPRFLRLDQFHLTTIQWVPFALAYFHGYFQSGAKRDLRLAAAFFSLQALTSGHGAAMLVVGMLLVAVERLLRGEPLAPVRRLRDLGVPGALALLPSALIYIPYRAAQVQVGLRRVLDDWSVSTSSFFSSASHFQTWLISRMPDWAWLKQEPDAWLFPGILPIVLAAAAFVVGLRPPSSGRGADYRWLYLAVVLVTLWFAIGPPYGVWRWVYWLPGLNFVRVPSRFMLLGVLGLGVLAGLGFDRLMATRLGGRQDTRRRSDWPPDARRIRRHAARRAAVPRRSAGCRHVARHATQAVRRGRGAAAGFLQRHHAGATQHAVHAAFARPLSTDRSGLQRHPAARATWTCTGSW